MRASLRTFLAVSLFLVSSATSDPVLAGAAGRIDSISPAAARPGDQVTITGNGFGGKNVRIDVGGVAAQVVAATGTAVTFVVPDGVTIGATSVVATNPGGQRGSIAFRVLLGFSVDSSAARQAVIGPGGGALSAESGGMIYTLTIPPAALEQDTPITLTPATSIANLPFSNGIAAGTHFAPSGLQLLRTATLTIDRPSGGFPAELLGFLVDDDGVALEVLGIAHGATQLVLPVDHFTAGGAGAPALSDFERQVLPLLNALPPSLPPSQVRLLIQLLAAWLDEFGFNVCAQTDLCAKAFDLSIKSLELNRTQMCAKAATFIQQGEPFLAKSTLEPFIKVAVNLVEVSELAAQVGVPGFDQPFDTSCAVNALHDIVDLARQQALANPRGSLLVLIADISADATFLEEEALHTFAVTTLKEDLMDTIAARAEQACPVDPVSGEALFDVILDHFVDTFLDALDPGFAEQLHDLRAGCRIQIVPALPTVAFDQLLALSATTTGLSPAGVTWSIEGPALGSTIDVLSGLFTAARNAGTVTVKATSIGDPTRFKRVPVQVVLLIQITITPATAVLAPGGTATFTAQVQGAGPLVTWSTTGGSIARGPSTSTTFTAGSTPGTFAVTAASVDDQTKFQSIPITIVAAATRLTGAITLVGHWDEAISNFREIVNVSMSAVVTVNMATDSQGRQFIPQAFGSATGSITGDALQIRVCGTEHDTFTGGTVVGATAFLHAPGATTDLRIRFSVNGTDNLSIPDSCGASVSIPKTGLSNLYSVPLTIEGTVLKSADGKTILGVDFNRTVPLDVVESAPGGGTITITGVLTPVP